MHLLRAVVRAAAVVTATTAAMAPPGGHAALLSALSPENTLTTSSSPPPLSAFAHDESTTQKIAAVPHTASLILEPLGLRILMPLAAPNTTDTSSPLHDSLAVSVAATNGYSMNCHREPKTAAAIGVSAAVEGDAACSARLDSSFAFILGAVVAMSLLK